jgi:ankyrin repeat protein
MKALKVLVLAAAVLVAAPTSHAQGIMEAVVQGDLATVKELVEKNPQLVKAKTAKSETLLHVAARLDNDAIAAYLIEKGADINALQNDLHTPLFEAGIKVTRVLVEHGANIDYATPDGTSAISWALHNHDREVFNYLFERKAKLTLPALASFGGVLAIESAFSWGNSGLLEIFAQQGLDPLFQNDAGMTLAHFAVKSNSTQLVEKLIAYGAPINRSDVFGWTPLHTAAYSGNQAVVELLVRKGLDKNARTLDGKTPYLLAKEAKNTNVADYLVSLGADRSAARPPVISGKYFGQKPPGKTPRPFVVSLPDVQKGLHGIFSFSPDGKEVYWKPEWNPRTTIFESRVGNGHWSAPRIAPFAAENQGDDVPFVSPDGNRLFFLSQRPVVDGKMPFPYVEKIWVMNRTALGWSEPQKLPETVNGVAGMHWQLSVDAKNNLYFGAQGGVHCARFVDGQYAKAERLGPPINDGKAASFSPFIAPDGRYLIFSRTHPLYFYQLFISFRKLDGTWTEAINLSDYLKHEYSLNGRVTPDGKYLFFTGRNGMTCWADASFIEELRRASGASA